MNKSSLEKSPQNRVTVYIWDAIKSEKDEKPVGHVAIRTYCGINNTEGRYLSFYPTTRVGALEISRRVQGRTISSYENECSDYHNGMQRKEEYPIDLYCLNVNRINEEIDRILGMIHEGSDDGDGIDWSLMGSAFTSFMSIDSGSKKPMGNCVSLVLYLLNQGGITELLNKNNPKRIRNAALLGGFWGAVGGGVGSAIGIQAFGSLVKPPPTMFTAAAFILVSIGAFAFAIPGGLVAASFQSALVGTGVGTLTGAVIGGGTAAVADYSYAIDRVAFEPIAVFRFLTFARECESDLYQLLEPTNAVTVEAGGDMVNINKKGLSMTPC